MERDDLMSADLAHKPYADIRKRIPPWWSSPSRPYMLPG